MGFQKHKLPGLMLGLTDGGALERRVMRLLEARAPWAMRWRAVSAASCVLVTVICCFCIAVVAIHAKQALRFEVVSIRPSEHGHSATFSSNVDFKADDSFFPTGGTFQVNSTLNTLIQFAYRLPPDQFDLLNKELPAWARWQSGGDGWTIQAKAVGNPTKDEYREMVKTMLIERFGLITHTETRNMPVYALVLDKPGSTGPALKPSEHKVPCSNPVEVQPPQDRFLPSTIDGTYPVDCGYVATVQRLRESFVVAGREASTEEIAQGLWVVSHVGMNGVDKPIVDGTGLSGKYDLRLQFDFRGTGNDSAPPFLVALKKQLGLRLKATTAPRDVLVIDHINRTPTEN